MEPISALNLPSTSALNNWSGFSFFGCILPDAGSHLSTSDCFARTVSTIQILCACRSSGYLSVPGKEKSLSAYQSICPLFLIFHDFKILYLLVYYSKHKVKNHCVWDSKPVAAQGKVGSFPSLNGPRLQEKVWLGLRTAFLWEQFLSLVSFSALLILSTVSPKCCSVCLILRFHTSFSQ